MGGDHALERGRAWPPVGGGRRHEPLCALGVGLMALVCTRAVRLSAPFAGAVFRGWPAARDGLDRSSGTPVDATRVGPLGQQEGPHAGGASSGRETRRGLRRRVARSLRKRPLSSSRRARACACLCTDPEWQGHWARDPDPPELEGVRGRARHQRRELGAHAQGGE